jgi:DNA-binding transcriptional LysR family regulator
LSKEQFCSLGHSAYSHPPYGYTFAEHFAGPIARNLHIQAMTDSFVDLVFLLRGTNLIALLQSRLARAAEIRVLPCPLPLTELNISMGWNALYSNDVAHTWLRNTLSEVTRESEVVEAD